MANLAVQAEHPFDDYQVLQPDLLFVSNERASVLTEANVQGAPDLVVEILSLGTTRRDLGRKRELYDEFGFREYWIVHQKKPCVEILRRGAGGKLLRVARLEPGEVVESPVLPGFVLPVDSLYLRIGLSGVTASHRSRSEPSPGSTGVSPDATCDRP